MNNPLRGALIGYGFIAESGHAAAYRERMRHTKDIEIVAVADICPARLAVAAQQMPGVRLYPTAEALLAAETGRIDYVDIATPPSEHASIAQAALARGLHVLCEKPLATTVDEARAMLHRAVESGRVVFPCHNYKHAPVVKAVRRTIDSGAIGKVHLVTLQTFRNIHALGVPEWRRDWRREKRYSGGGIAMDHGSHTFYLAFEWMQSYPTAITARMSTLGAFDTEDDFSCSLKFPTGAASAHLSWQAGVRKVLYTIHGDKGAIRVEDDAIEVATMQPGKPGMNGGVTWQFERESVLSNWMDSSHVTWFDSLLNQFRDAIAAGDFAGKEAREAFLCVQLINQAYASAREGSREMALSARI